VVVGENNCRATFGESLNKLNRHVTHQHVNVSTSSFDVSMFNVLWPAALIATQKHEGHGSVQGSLITTLTLYTMSLRHLSISQHPPPSPFHFQECLMIQDGAVHLWDAHRAEQTTDYSS
jgi:hypothetical protein